MTRASRLRKGRGFAIAAAEVLQRHDIPIDTKGLWTILLSYPDDWEFHVGHIMGVAGVGKDRYYRMTGELRELGLLEMIQVRDPDTQQILGTDWIVHHDVQTSAEPHSGSPGVRASGTLTRRNGNQEEHVNQEEQDLSRAVALEWVEPSPTPSQANQQMFLALCQVMRADPNGLARPEAGRYRKAAKDLVEVGATPQQVVARAVEFISRWDVPLTPTALVSHWGSLANPRVTKAQVEAEIRRQESEAWYAEDEA